MTGKFAVARKEHTCTLCGEPIVRGAKYWRGRLTSWSHGVNEGFTTFKAHAGCFHFWEAEYGAVADWMLPVGLEREFGRLRSEYEKGEAR